MRKAFRVGEVGRAVDQVVEQLESRWLMAVVNGLTGQYFDNQNFTGATVTRVDPTVNFEWGAGSPSSAIAPDSFSASMNVNGLAARRSSRARIDFRAITYASRCDVVRHSLPTRCASWCNESTRSDTPGNPAT